MRKLCKAVKRHHIDGLFILLPVSYSGVETKPIFFKYDERNATVESFLLYAYMFFLSIDVTNHLLLPVIGRINLKCAQP